MIKSFCRAGFGRRIAVILIMLGTWSSAEAQETILPTLSLGTPVAPQENQPATDNLTERLEKLEKQNLDLLQKIQSLEGKEKGTGKNSPAPADTETKTDGMGNIFEVNKNLKLSASWKNGLWLETPEKAFRFNVGGVIQYDMVWMGAAQNVVNSVGVFNNLEDPRQSLDDSFDFRRARLRFAGQLYEQFEFYAQYDFAQSLDLRRRTLGSTPGGPVPPNSDVAPVDTVLFNEVWVGLMKLPLIGEIRVGRHRESLNFISATSDTNQVWMERGLMFDAFNGDYLFSNGIIVDNSYFEGRAYSMFGWFMQNDNFGNRSYTAVGDGEYAYDARLTYLPLWNPDDQQWVHVGMDYSYRNLHMDEVRYRARPMLRDGSSFQVPNILNTGVIFSRDAQQVANLEFAASLGRWTLASDISCSWVTNAYTGGLPLANGKLPKGAQFHGTYFAEGAYVECLYFLTPDHRVYRKERPGYDRVIPSSNFFCLPGEDGPVFSRGAWEIGIRYDYVDLTNSGINGGTGQAVTLALNWYLNPNFRVQANYSWMNREFNPSDTAGRVNGPLQGFGIRCNCDF